MSKSIDAKEAVRLIARKIRVAENAYGKLPEFWAEYSDEICEYAIKTLARCSDLPKDIRPKTY
jgi:hypothetical protein